MKSTARCALLLALYALLGSTRAPAQVQTEVPPVVPGAKPVSVEHIKVHGLALEGNLEGDAVDRDVIVFLPPELRQGKVPPLSGRLRAARLFDRRRAMDRRDSRSADD